MKILTCFASPLQYLVHMDCQLLKKERWRKDSNYSNEPFENILFKTPFQLCLLPHFNFVY